MAKHRDVMLCDKHGCQAEPLAERVMGLERALRELHGAVVGPGHQKVRLAAALARADVALKEDEAK